MRGSCIDVVDENPFPVFRCTTSHASLLPLLVPIYFLQERHGFCYINMMFIIPAIDLKDGQCVRLRQGKKEDVTVYSGDPPLTAGQWESSGAAVLHVVDLDGAFTGSQKNFDSIVRIRNSVKMIIEVGGGIRDLETVERLTSAGINRVILGTSAIEDSGFVAEACRLFPGKILVGIDAKDGKVAVRGWEKISAIDARELAVKVEAMGVSGIIYTDISRDGMLSGPNLPALRDMVSAVKTPVIASGGIASIHDIKNLLEIGGLWGAITGKAIYSGALDLREAIKLSKEQGRKDKE
jgi:phosphoribosylformimino-5-aminoimidazole carboxamide ribotide isomerase